MQIEEYLKADDRCVVPLGSTEQHAYLSLFTDSILSERVATDAAAPLGIPVFPAVPYGLAHHWTAFPGTVTLRMETYLGVIGDILDSLAHAGFRRILMVNGHGGNMPAANYARQWIMSNPEVRVLFHNWYAAPKFSAADSALQKERIARRRDLIELAKLIRTENLRKVLSQMLVESDFRWYRRIQKNWKSQCELLHRGRCSACNPDRTRDPDCPD